MPVKRQTTSSPRQETSYTAITLNPESNFSRREKNHSLFHWNTLTCPELLTRIWKSSKQNASMIIGVSMGQETCLNLGQVSHNLLYWKKNLQKDICGPGGDYQENSLHPGQTIEETAYIQARSSMARTLEVNGKECQAEGEAKVVWREAPSWKRKKIARDLFHRPRRIRNSKKPSRMLVRIWKHQWLLLCLVKFMKNCGNDGSNKIKNKNLRVFWKLVNLQDCVWENHYQIIMKTMLPEKKTIHHSIKIWFTNLFLCLKP